MTDDRPGRSCPLHYRYSPSVFRSEPQPALAKLDTLYVVGGLYGNPHALAAAEALFAQESGQASGKAQMVFNGDFHWFDAEPELFAQIQAGVMRHTALRGNVETEIADPDYDEALGCGCGYPDWVEDAVVTRSNDIIVRLRAQATAAQQAELARLPMWLRASVGSLQLGIVHGDAASLSGWGFAQEHLVMPEHRAQAQAWLQASGLQAFACTHTCLPVFRDLSTAPEQPQHIFNNGAAGMPNLQNDLAGLLIRISRHPATGAVAQARRFGRTVVHQGQTHHIDAIGLDYDQRQWQQDFEAIWPPGSDAHVSYFKRITQATRLSVEQAMGNP